MKTIKTSCLFDAARQAAVPEVHVADAVLTTLAMRRRPMTSFQRSLMWVSMASSAAAAVVMLTAFWAWQQQADSVTEIMNMVSWAAQ